jgi:hypothetical protein
VMLFDGASTRSLSRGRVNGQIGVIGGSALLDTNNFLTVNPIRHQVWVCIVNGSVGNKPDKVLIWDWESDTWGSKTPASTTFTAATTGLTEVANGEALIIGESALDNVGILPGNRNQDFNVSYDSTIELIGIHLENTDIFKTLHRSRINFDGADAQELSVYHGSSKTADASPTYTSAATYTVDTTDYVDKRATAGRFLAIKLTWTRSVSESLGRVRSIDLDVTAGGTR